MTPLPVTILAAIAAFVLLVVVLELIRSRRLRERYGVETYPPAILGAVGALFILVVLLHYSTVISRLSDQNVILAQRLALLEQRLREDRVSDGRGS